MHSPVCQCPLQVEFSLCHALPERSGLLEACRELGVTPVAYSPLAMGRLTGKYSSSNKPQVRKLRVGLYCQSILVDIYIEPSCRERLSS